MFLWALLSPFILHPAPFLPWEEREVKNSILTSQQAQVGVEWGNPETQRGQGGLRLGSGSPGATGHGAGRPHLCRGLICRDPQRPGPAPSPDSHRRRLRRRMRVRGVSDLSHLRQAKFVFSFSVGPAAGGRGKWDRPCRTFSRDNAAEELKCQE